MKLSDLDPKEVQAVEPKGGLRLSDLSSNDVMPADEPQTSVGDALVGSFANNITAGMAPKIYGAIHSPSGALKSAGNYIGIKSDEADPEVMAYIKAKQAESDNLDLLQKQHPIAYGTGAVAGALAMPLPPVARIPSLAGRAAAMAGIGGAMGLARSNANSPMEAAKDFGGAAATGAILQPALEKAIPAAAGKASEWLDDLSNSATKMHLRPTAQTARAIGPEGLDEIAQAVRQSGAMKFGSKVGDTAENLAGLKSEIGQQLGSQRSQIASSGAGVRPEDVENAISSAGESVNKTGANQGAENRIKGIADDVMNKSAPNYQNMGEQQIPFDKLGEIGTELQGNINYQTEGKAFNKGMRGAAANIRGVEAGAAPTFEGPLFRSQMDRYSNIADASKMANRTAGLADGGNGLMGQIADVGAFSTGANAIMHGNPWGAAVIGARALTKGRVASSVAVGADLMSKALNPQNIIKQLSNTNASRFIPAIQKASQDADSLSATHFILQQTEPEYSKAVNGN